MGIVLTTVYAGRDSVVIDVTATSVKDKTATIPHTLTALGGVVVPARVEVYWSQLLSEAYVSRWSRTSVDQTNVVMTKLSTGASANAAAQLRVTIKRPHSIGQ